MQKIFLIGRYVDYIVTILVESQFGDTHSHFPMW